MRSYTRPEPLGEDRAAFRRKNLAEIRAANADALTSYGWQDQTRGVVRLPIDQAMKLVEQQWQNPGLRPFQFDRPGGKGHGAFAQGPGKTEPVRIIGRV